MSKTNIQTCSLTISREALAMGKSFNWESTEGVRILWPRASHSGLKGICFEKGVLKLTMKVISLLIEPKQFLANTIS